MMVFYEKVQDSDSEENNNYILKWIDWIDYRENFEFVVLIYGNSSRNTDELIWHTRGKMVFKLDSEFVGLNFFPKIL